MVTRSYACLCKFAHFKAHTLFCGPEPTSLELQYLHKWQGLFPYFTAHFGDGVMRWSGLRKSEMSK